MLLRKVIAIYAGLHMKRIHFVKETWNFFLFKWVVGYVQQPLCFKAFQT